jgi:hypothetical protein
MHYTNMQCFYKVNILFLLLFIEGMDIDRLLQEIDHVVALLSLMFSNMASTSSSTNAETVEILRIENIDLKRFVCKYL